MVGLTLHSRNQGTSSLLPRGGRASHGAASPPFLAPPNLPRQCGPSSEPSKQSWSPLQSLLMWMQSSVPRQLCSLGWQRDTLLWGPARTPKGQHRDRDPPPPLRVPTPSLSRGRGTGRFMGGPPPSPAQGDLISVINWKNYKGSQALFLSSSEKKQGMETNNKHTINPLTA